MLVNQERLWDHVKMLCEEIGPRLVSQGRFDSLSAWINRLPEKVLSAQPGLYLLLGDVLRLRVQFDEALEHYRVAERLFATQPNRVGRSHALRGQAQVYLDTVRPLMADSLLEEALRLLEPAEHQHETADLLDKLAENKLNLGYPEEAQALHHEAGLLRAETEPGDVYLEARAMVRTGRLAEALLPEGYELLDTALFDGEAKRPTVVIGAFSGILLTPVYGAFEVQGSPQSVWLVVAAMLLVGFLGLLVYDRFFRDEG